jgi:hypothetical protein
VVPSVPEVQEEGDMTIRVKVLADSIGEFAPRLTGLQCRYPKFIHGEFLTHRVLSRNSSSSRAIPVERLVHDVMEDPVIPTHWGKNQRGMQADGECDAFVFGLSREEAWLMARDKAVDMAIKFSNAGYHKQIVNRLLEPFCHINTVVSSTQWSNFFALRRHPDAQPEMRQLADAIYEAMAASQPVLLKPGEWHLPYVLPTEKESDCPRGQLIKLSVARVARVSYLTQDGRKPDRAEDLALHDRLVGSVPLHASPAEHQATPVSSSPLKPSSIVLSLATGGNFGPHWVQYRKTLPGECQ